MFSTDSARWLSALVRPVGRALSTLPRPVRYAAVDGISLTFWALTPRRRQATAKNFGYMSRQSRTAPSIQRLVRRAYKNYGRMSLDFLIFSAVANAPLLANTTVRGRQFADEALQRGHGAVLVLPHLGNWDLAARVCLALGYRLTTVVENDWAAAFAGA